MAKNINWKRCFLVGLLSLPHAFISTAGIHFNFFSIDYTSDWQALIDLLVILSVGLMWGGKKEKGSWHFFFISYLPVLFWGLVQSYDRELKIIMVVYSSAFISFLIAIIVGYFWQDEPTPYYALEEVDLSFVITQIKDHFQRLNYVKGLLIGGGFSLLFVTLFAIDMNGAETVDDIANSLTDDLAEIFMTFSIEPLIGIVVISFVLGFLRGGIKKPIHWIWAIFSVIVGIFFSLVMLNISRYILEDTRYAVLLNHTIWRMPDFTFFRANFVLLAPRLSFYLILSGTLYGLIAGLSLLFSSKPKTNQQVLQVQNSPESPKPEPLTQSQTVGLIAGILSILFIFGKIFGGGNKTQSQNIYQPPKPRSFSSPTPQIKQPPLNASHPHNPLVQQAQEKARRQEQAKQQAEAVARQKAQEEKLRQQAEDERQRKILEDTTSWECRYCNNFNRPRTSVCAQCGRAK